MAGQAINTKIPPSYKRPGVYTTFVLGDPGGAQPQNRVLVWAYLRPGASATPNTAFLPSGITEVRNTCGGPGCMAARMYSAAKSDPRYRGAEVWVMPIAAPSGGTKAKHLVKIMAEPLAGVLQTNTTASAARTLGLFFSGRGSWISDRAGMTFVEIAAALHAELSKRSDLPGQMTLVGDTIEFEDLDPGEHGNDMPVVVWLESGSGVAVSCGTITFAGTTTAVGTVTAKLNARRTTAAIASGDDEDNSAVKVRDALNVDGFCVYGAVASPATGVLTLFYRSGRPVHRLDFTLTGGTGQTLTKQLGVVGVGVPTLTAALSRLSADKRGYEHAIFFTDTSNVGALAAHLIVENETPKEKPVGLHLCLPGSLTDVAEVNLPDATTPKLTSDILFSAGFWPGGPVSAFEMAARMAALVASAGDPQTNFNGSRFMGSELSPLGTPHEADWATDEEVNQAISVYKLSPITVDEGGYNVLEYSGTTYKSIGTADQKAEKVSYRRTLQWCRLDLRISANDVFKGKSIKLHGEPRTDRGVTPAGVRSFVFRKMTEWDAADRFDGAEFYRDAIKVAVLEGPTRINVEMPFVPLGDLNQLTNVGVTQ